MNAQAAPLDDDQTLSAIRSVLTEPVEVSAPVPEMTREPRIRAEMNAQPAETVAANAQAAEPEVLSKPSMIDRMRGISYRPSRKLIGWGVVALLVVLFPHVFVIGAVVMAVIIGGSFAVFGSDAVWGLAMRGFSRFASLAPKRAARAALRLDAFALRWDGFLDRFPDGSVDGLYLPDFQAQSKADEHHTAVMSERLARMQTSAQA
jgi:hypothetical protein